MLLNLPYHVLMALKNQYASPEYLKKWQQKRLKHMIEHAYRNTRFYHQKFREAGIHPHDIQGLSDMQKIPLISKDEVRNQGADSLVAQGYDERNCEVHYTSGSSGKMLRILYDSENHLYESAIAYRYHLGQGVRPWHRYYLILHDEKELQDTRKRSILHRTMGVAGDLPDEEKIRLAQDYNPHVMGGHLSSLISMGKIMETQQIDSIRPRILIVGGELSLPAHRRYVERVFGGATYDKYGAFEVKSIAWECRHHTMHMDADSVMVEFLKDGEPVAPGERGEVVVTSLWNKAMPFIRYRLGDIGVPSDKVCECGRTLPAMEIIEGRLDDFIVLPSGAFIPPGAVVPLFLSVTQVDQFKIVQDKKDSIRVQIRPGQGYTHEIEQGLIQKMKEVLGEPVHIDVEHVESIEQIARGKFRAVISHVGVDLSHL
ncbi:MAG: phenylacetate--CoA ligase family protein [Theionarchaea archaeon]|nr:phenylacetate--CoA ligase family protein [Theionarchaea archaeon]MBU7000093.1 phenylacetate--CoA ligase family protein [Theionarchaea archaeon]MBU7020810.1 phenylacetate--CoA ligase family protein [Theionarchaea archaeon]MBU7033954.1 phenylacetate--CoA ligase family protein [Theionarchaea archaeon]MBU7039250.1 phenylacetate--CoA ligase family protein [Theionarchaea archaeon]